MDLGINQYRYEQYRSIYCKILKKEPKHKAMATDLQIIEDLIEEISMYHSPESWCGHFQLLKDQWLPSTTEHHLIAKEIIKACWYYQNIEIQEGKQERDEYLSWFGFEGGVEGLKKETKEKQLEAAQLLKRWYETSSINENDELNNIVFNKHLELQHKFLHQLFQENARFYINKTIEQTKVCLYENKRISPAIVGIDNEKMALLWFNH